MRSARMAVWVGVSASLVAGCHGDGGDSGGPEGPGRDFRPCGDQAVWYHSTPLGVSPSDILAIEPLGHVIAPGHTWPADHVYLTPRRPGDGTSLPVRAMGAMRVWQIDVNTHQYVTGPRYTDFSIRFSPCREIEGFFHHVQALVHPALLAALAADEAAVCHETTFDNGEFQGSCKHRMAVDLTEGEVLGMAGGPGVQGNIDFGAYDTRTSLAFANPARVSEDVAHPRFDYLRVVCPLDAFDPVTREALSSRLGALSSVQNTVALAPRTAEPACGTIMQDVPGTAQGIWALDGQAGIADVGRHLALVHDNFDPRRAVLASGGGPLGIHETRFLPRPDGLVDRDFAAVVWGGPRGADGAETIYCYDLVSGPNHAGSLILQMTAADSLRAESRTAGCTAPLAFTAPVIYRR
jgi:hypothetical protein